MSLEILSCRNLKKQFVENQVLRGIDLQINKGESLAIIGASGSGKSTLLRCLNFLEIPSSGEVSLRGELIGSRQNGQVLYQERDLIPIRAKIGMVFQHFNLFPHMTVLQNVMEGPRTVLKLPKSEYESRAISYLEKVGIPEKRNAYPSELSGGQQQRVAIARALAMEPEIMLFDEATSALDPELVGEVLDVILKLMQEGLTCVLVTHELGFAYSAAQRVLFMHNGVVLEEGSAYDVLVEPQQPRTVEFLRGHSRFQLPSPKNSQ
tara:strand:- start:1268 stop:2059 length:792 start_codon:yes stop_codon:yes gene_type:complete